MVTELDPNVMRLNQVTPSFQQGMAYGANFIDQAQEAQRQNAYQNLLRQPGAVDEQGNIAPQTMRGIAPLVAPQIYQQLQEAQRLQQQQQINIAMQKAGFIADTAAGVDAAYQEQLKSGVPESIAIQSTQPIYDAALDKVRGSGLFSQPELSKLNTKFNPRTNRATALQSATYRGQLATMLSGQQKALQEQQKIAREQRDFALRSATLGETQRHHEFEEKATERYHRDIMEERRAKDKERADIAKTNAQARSEHQQEVAENQRRRFIENEIDKSGTAAGRSWDAQMNAGLLQTPSITPTIDRDQWVEQAKTSRRFQLQNNVNILQERATAKQAIDVFQKAGRDDLVAEVKRRFEQNTGESYDHQALPMRPLQSGTQ
jgi:hypothetical protein